jgi:hypothetical protein
MHNFSDFINPSCQDTQSVWRLATGGRTEDRIQVRARFSAAVQTGHGTHPASSTLGTWSFPGVKRLVSGVDHPSTFSAEVKERLELCLYPFSGPSWPVIGWTLLFLTLLYSLVVSKTPTSVCQYIVVRWHVYERWITAVIHVDSRSQVSPCGICGG